MAHTGGSEATWFVDSVTGQKVFQLTSSHEHSVHAYYDTPPWCPVTNRVVFSRHAPGVADGGVYIVDADGENLTCVARSQVMTDNPNYGAMAQWSADGRRVYYRDGENGESLVGWVEVESGESGWHPGHLRMVRPVGDEQLYHSDYDHLSDDQVVAERDTLGVFVQDFVSGRSRQLVSYADCLALHPRRAEIANWHLYIRHVKWSPRGDRLLLVFTNQIYYPNKYSEIPPVKDVYVVNADGSGLIHVGEIGGRPMWHPNGREILTKGPFEGRPGWSLVLTDVDTGKRRLATDLIAGVGHPSCSPDGARIVVDHVIPKEGLGTLNVVNTDTQTIRHLIRTKITDHSHVGTHLHPVWSRDGSQLLYASDASGVAQLCVITLPETS